MPTYHIEAYSTACIMYFLSPLQDIVEPFLRPELADRLAAMLNFNLLQLCGTKCEYKQFLLLMKNLDLLKPLKRCLDVTHR